MRLPILLTTLALVTALVSASACGSDEEAADGATDVGQTIEVAAKDFSFTPGKLQAEAGRSFEVALRNSGSVPHTFTIDEYDVDVELGAGEETSVGVTPSGPGQVSYYCRFHRAQGMQGTITVTGDAGAGAPSPGSPTPADTDDGYSGY